MSETRKRLPTNGQYGDDEKSSMSKFHPVKGYSRKLSQKSKQKYFTVSLNISFVSKCVYVIL